MTKWIGVDFDRTLATFDGDLAGPLGKPIKPMLERVKSWLKAGREVRIFTARADSPLQRQRVAQWLADNGVAGLTITNRKDGDMAELWDDLAIRTEPNNGKVCPECAAAARFHRRDTSCHALTDC